MILGVYEQTGDTRLAAAHGAGHRALLPVLDHRAARRTRGSVCRATSIAATGPAPEVLADEKDAAGRTHYDRVREYYRTHDVADYDESLYYDSAHDQLTDLFYKGDRSMRESGFDPSNRFGAFNVDVIHYAPVCLNTLLYLMEDDAARIMTTLGDGSGRGSVARARGHRGAIGSNQLLWDEEAGLYYDYNFRTRRLRRYDFATTFYPLWAGVASQAQAASRAREPLEVRSAGRPPHEHEVTGNQWDAPFGWAPLQMIAVDGLRRYGFHEDADRIAAKFVSLVAKEFEEHGTIVEKYDVRRRESDVAAGITFGYSANQIGFGWTNGAVLDLLAGLRQPVGPGVESAAPRLDWSAVRYRLVRSR